MSEFDALLSVQHFDVGLGVPVAAELIERFASSGEILSMSDVDELCHSEGQTSSLELLDMFNTYIEEIRAA